MQLNRYNKILKNKPSTGKASDVFGFLIQPIEKTEKHSKHFFTRKQRSKNKKELFRIELNDLEKLKTLTRRDERRIRKLKKRLGLLRSKRKNKVVKRHKTERVPKKYSVYINSAFWERRKNLYWKSHKRECEKCRSKKFVQLHHMYYDNTLFGVEPDEHFCALCLDCHTQFHTLHKTKKNLIVETKKFLLT